MLIEKEMKNKKQETGTGRKWVGNEDNLKDPLKECFVRHFVDENGNQINIYYPRRQTPPSEEGFRLAIPSEIYEAYKAHKATEKNFAEKNSGIDFSSKHTRRSCRKAKENTDGEVQSEG